MCASRGVIHIPPFRESPVFLEVCQCPTPSRSALSRFPPPRAASWWCFATSAEVRPRHRKALGKAADLVKRAAATNQFKGKSGSTLDILAPEGIKIQRLIVIGTGKAADLKEKDFLKFGGVLAGKLNAGQ